MKDRKQRVRYKSKKVSNRNRLSVFRSNNHIYAQLIDDSKGITLASSSSVEQNIKDMNLSRKETAEMIGKSIAKKIISKEFKPHLIKKMNDEEAIEYLSNLRQIGRWPAEMILLFTFNRSNIWPLQDIGLLRAISNNYNKKYFP